jgi:tetraacyldisaccharide 4'-kinase
MHKRTDPFEFIYFLGYSIVKKYKLSKQKSLPSKVVSIGNITTGGTGKTPAVIAIAQEAKKRGLSPVILTRGYKGKAKEPVLVNFPKSPLQTFDQAQNVPLISTDVLGDEAFMMAEKLRDVPLVKYPNRYLGGQLALEKLKGLVAGHKIVFILDDGFQHWSLYRDIDIVLVDGINPFGNRKLLPFGVLREQPYELKRADFLVITKKRNEELNSRLKLINTKAPVYFAEYKAGDVRYPDGRSISPDELQNKRFFAFCGIAHPESFKIIVSSLKINVNGWEEFPDHYNYREKDILRIKKLADKLNCGFLITTEKDIVKLKFLKNLSNVLYVDIEFTPDPGFYEEVFKKIQ